MLEKDKAETRAREAARAALNEYRDLMKVKAATVTTDRDHYLISVTQIESAKRVLWMED